MLQISQIIFFFTTFFHIFKPTANIFQHTLIKIE